MAVAFVFHTLRCDLIQIGIQLLTDREPTNGVNIIKLNTNIF